MREQLLDDALARRFLLGQLPPEEQGRIEELAFEDPDTFTLLESIENDLIDEFIHGDLSADEEKQFESHFLSLPGRRNNLKISRLLQRHFNNVAAAPPRKTSSFPGWLKSGWDWFRRQSIWVQIPITAAAAIALVIVFAWILSRVLQAREPVTLQAEHDRPAAISSPEFKASPSVHPTASPGHAENKPKSLPPEKQKSFHPYALLAPSGLSRGEGVPQVELTPDAASVTIELPLITQSSFRRYEAALQNEAEKVLQVWPDLKAEDLRSGKALKIDVPLKLLRPQEFYRVVVSGVSSKGEMEVIARYPFEVIAP